MEMGMYGNELAAAAKVLERRKPLISSNDVGIEIFEIEKR